MKKLIIIIIFLTSYAVLSANDEIKKYIKSPELIKEAGKIICLKSLTPFYEKNNFKPFWTNIKLQEAFVDELKKAAFEGLDPGEYHYNYLSIHLYDLTAESHAINDILLTDAFLLYAGHLQYGKKKAIKKLSEKGNIIEDAFNKTVNTKYLTLKLDDMRPKSTEYIELKKKLRYYYNLKDVTEDNIPDGTLIRPDSSDPRIPSVRKKIEKIGDLKLPLPQDNTLYDNDLAVQIKILQKDYGLTEDGIIGAKTVQILNLPLKDRISHIKDKMDRLRSASGK